MKRMVTDEQIIELIKKYAPGFDPSTIESGDIVQNAVLGLDSDGELVKGNLFGKYVRIIDAPASRTLTAEEKAAIIEGCFINGTFMGYKNPVFMPGRIDTLGRYFGGVICPYASGSKSGFILKAYYITSGGYIDFPGNSDIGIVTLPNGGDSIMLFGKTLTKFPTTGNVALSSSNGELDWRPFTSLYLHTVVFDVGAGQSFTIRLISDSSTACALDAGTGNFTVPDSTFIQPANVGNVIIIPFNANQFTPDIYAFNSATGAFTDNITLASITSDTVTPIG